MGWNYFWCCILICVFAKYLRDGDISWTMTSRGHFLSKWATSRGHCQRVTSRGHFLVTSRGHFCAPPLFGRSVNPISTGMSTLCPPHYCVPSQIFGPSDGPVWKLKVPWFGYWTFRCYLIMHVIKETCNMRECIT